MFHRPSAAIDKRKITTALAGQQEQRNVAANSMCQHGRHTTGRHAPPAQTRRNSRRRLSEITSDQRPVRKINAKEQRALKREPLAPSSSPYQLGRECWKAGGSQRTRQRRTGWSPLPERGGGGGWVVPTNRSDCPRARERLQLSLGVWEPTEIQPALGVAGQEDRYSGSAGWFICYGVGGAIYDPGSMSSS